MFIVTVQIDSGGPPVAGESYNLTCIVLESLNAIHYQWLKEGGNLSNKTNQVLTFPSLHLTDAGNYTCDVAAEGTITGTSNTSTIVPQSEFR